MPSQKYYYYIINSLVYKPPIMKIKALKGYCFMDQRVGKSELEIVRLRRKLLFGSNFYSLNASPKTQLAIQISRNSINSSFKEPSFPLIFYPEAVT